jgi:hypothetical protein
MSSYLLVNLLATDKFFPMSSPEAASDSPLRFLIYAVSGELQQDDQWPGRDFLSVFALALSGDKICLL